MLTFERYSHVRQRRANGGEKNPSVFVFVVVVVVHAGQQSFVLAYNGFYNRQAREVKVLHISIKVVSFHIFLLIEEGIGFSRTNSINDFLDGSSLKRYLVYLFHEWKLLQNS